VYQWYLEFQNKKPYVLVRDIDVKVGNFYKLTKDVYRVHRLLQNPQNEHEFKLEGQIYLNLVRSDGSTSYAFAATDQIDTFYFDDLQKFPDGSQRDIQHLTSSQNPTENISYCQHVYRDGELEVCKRP
jgi:hypothetical protein